MCKTKGSIAFQLLLNLYSLTGQIVIIGEGDSDLSSVPWGYWQFADIFCKQKAKTLLNHYSYNLLIQIEEGTSPPLRPIYSLSLLELQTLWDFINKNIKISIIRPSNSPCGALVLFIKKKDGTLRLCVDYWGLNHLTRKDRYPIPLITDLLDAPKRAWHYTKIDLRSAYHLVHIAEGNK